MSASGTVARPGSAGHLVPGDRLAVASVDLMRVCFQAGSPFDIGSRRPLESAARIVGAARAARVPVVHTRVVYGPDAADAGVYIQKMPALRALVGDGDANRIMPAVGPRPDELVVVKQYVSAFFGTPLASTLRSWGVDTLVIVGVSTSGCVRASAVDAMQHGLVPIVVADAVGDRDETAHRASLDDLQAAYAEVVDEATAIGYLGGWAG
ncbi:MAG: isochorismatase family protein [Acidimicrobiales bacterium]